MGLELCCLYAFSIRKDGYNPTTVKFQLIPSKMAYPFYMWF